MTPSVPFAERQFIIKMKRKYRCIVVLLSIVMLLCSMPQIAWADVSKKTDDISDGKPTWADVVAGLADPRDMYDPLDPETVPEIIGYDVAYERSHVKRMYEKETDLNSVIFQNADGTETIYLYDYPVKYVDENGDIHDISLSIKKKDDSSGAYTTADNSVQTYFSKRLTDGISLENKEISVQMIPMSARPSMKKYSTFSAPKSFLASSQVEMIDKKTVSYLYDEKTTIEYSLTYTGFKEDIVVSEYTGQTEYDFTLLTNGLALEENDGSFQLVDDNGTVRAYIGDIIVFTADQRNNTFGWLTARTVTEGQEYVLTVHVEADYLADEKTVYPIRIDPTIEINYDANGASAIQDVTINSLQGSDGSSSSLFVGKRATYGISRTLMRFPGLSLSSIASADRITSAYVTMRDVLCEGEAMTVYCYPFTGNSWSESTADWSNVNPNSYGTSLSSKSISYSNGVNQSTAHHYQFDITEAVRGWKAGNYSQAKGIIFKASSTIENGSTNINKTFASYNRSGGRPSLSVTYTTSGSSILPDDTYYVNNIDTGKYLKYAPSSISGVSGSLSKLTTYIRWQVRHVDGGWVLRSVYDTTKYLAVSTDIPSSVVEVVSVTNGTIPTRCKWTVSISKIGGCLFKNVYNSSYLCSNKGIVYTTDLLDLVYNKCAWRCIITSSYGTTTSYKYQELSNISSFSPSSLECFNEADIKVTCSPTNVIWASPSDFTYTLSSTDYVNLDLNDYKIYGKESGSFTLKVTHKVTDVCKELTFKVNPYNFRIGFSTDNYMAGCPFGERQSYTYANEFYNSLTLTSDFSKTRCGYSNVNSFGGASKDNFQNGSTGSGVLANGVDLMVYIGHGISADRDNFLDTYVGDRNKGNFLHYNYGTNAQTHSLSCSKHLSLCHCDCYNDNYNLYTSEAKFGSSESRLRWVWLYTCNFLNLNEYVDNNDLRSMMNGAHIVLGYGSSAYLKTAVVKEFTTHLNNSVPIIKAFFRLSPVESTNITGDYIQRVMFYSAAEGEHINSKPVKYQYYANEIKFGSNVLYMSAIWS